MAAFEYLALNQKGREEKGILEADSSRQVRQILRDKGLSPLSVSTTHERSAGTGNLLGNILTPSISARDLALITRQLATLIESGLPVEEALKGVSQQNERPRIRAMLLAIRSKVLEGYSMAKSLAEYPRAFPELYRATIASGEAAGHLDLVLKRLAEYTESRHASRLRIQQAMVYPTILFVLTIAILAGLLGYVVPDIVKVFSDSGQELPLLTRLIISISHFVAQSGLFIGLGIVVLVVAVRKALQKPEIRLAWHRHLLHLPLVSGMSRSTGAAQFASTLSILTASGVPLVEAMGIAEQVISNKWLQSRVAEARLKVSEGASLHLALQHSGYFPPMMVHMIASGEMSGELDKMLARVSDYLQQDLEMVLGVILSLFGPVMLLVMGGAVFTIVMAILLPIMNLNQLVT